MKNFQTGNSCPVNDLACDPAKSRTLPDRSLFRVGDALLESAIAVSCVRVGHARTESEYDEAWAELESLRSQRESAWATAEQARAQLRVDIDNRIQDLLHQQMDAERVPGK